MDQQAYSMIGEYSPINIKPFEIKCLKCGSNFIIVRERQDIKIKKARKSCVSKPKRMFKRPSNDFKDYVCINCFHEFSKEDYYKRYEK